MLTSFQIIPRREKEVLVWFRNKLTVSGQAGGGDSALSIKVSTNFLGKMKHTERLVGADHYFIEEQQDWELLGEPPVLNAELE